MSVSTGTTNKAYISAISLLDKREILKDAVDIYGEEGLTDILSMAGKMTKTSVGTFHDYVADPMWQLIDTTGATVTNSGTATVTIAGLPVGSSGILVKGQTLLTLARKEAFVNSVTSASGQDTIVIKSVGGGNLTVTAGDKLSPVSNIAGEASTAGTNLRFGYTKYSNNVRIFKGLNEITDIQDISEVEIEFNGQPFVFDKEAATKFIKFKGEINASYIAGNKSTSLFSDSSPSLVDPVGAGAMQSGSGLDEYVVARGVNGAVSSAGTVTISDINTYLLALTAARAGQKFTVYGSTQAHLPMATFLKGLGSSAITSARLNVDGKEVDLDVEVFKHAGFSLQLATMPILNHPVFFSQTNIVKSLYFVPETKVNVQGGGSVDRMRVRYMPSKDGGSKNLGNEIYAEWDTGSLARTGATSDTSIRRTNWKSIQGLQLLGAEHFGKWQTA